MRTEQSSSIITTTHTPALGPISISTTRYIGVPTGQQPTIPGIGIRGMIIRGVPHGVIQAGTGIVPGIIARCTGVVVGDGEGITDPTLAAIVPPTIRHAATHAFARQV